MFVSCNFEQFAQYIEVKVETLTYKEKIYQGNSCGHWSAQRIDNLIVCGSNPGNTGMEDKSLGLVIVMNQLKNKFFDIIYRGMQIFCFR